MSYGDTEPSEIHGGEAAAVAFLAPVNRVTFDRIPPTASPVRCRSVAQLGR